MAVRGTGKYVKFMIYVIVVILVNVAGMTLFFRADLTEGKVYSISEASRRVVSTLSEPLTIKVFFTKNLPAPYNNTMRYLQDLLKEYGHYGNRYFNYLFYDVSGEDGDIGQETKENQAMARNYGILPVQIQAVEKDEIKFLKAYMGLVIIHGDLLERIPTVSGTEGLEYLLTASMQKLNNKISALLRLEGKIGVRLFLSSSLEKVAPYMRLDDLPLLPQTVEEIVKKLNEKHYGKLFFEYLDPSKDSKVAEAVRKFNLMNLKWPSLSDGKIEAGEGTIGLVMEHDEKIVTVPLIRAIRLPLVGTQYEMADRQRLEEIISGNVESLIDIHEDLGYLVSHGTVQLYPPPGDQRAVQARNEARNFSNLASANYTIKPVNLKENPIPESFNCLVLAGPTESFTEYELFEIDQFLMKGKSVAIFMDRFHEITPPDQAGARGQGPRIVPLETGLETLLTHYGIKIRNSYVMDENCFKQRMPAHFGGGEQAIYFAPIIKSEFINRKLGFMNNIKGLVVFKVSPLDRDQKRIEGMGLKVHRLFSSSDKSWEMTGRIELNPMLIQPPSAGDAMKSFDLAYLVEGSFESYFAGKPIPEKPAAQKESGKKEDGEVPPQADLSKIEGDAGVLVKGKPGKIVLIASSEMIKDNLVDEGGNTPNAMFVLNLLDYLNDREEIALMRSKEQRFNPLMDTGGGTRTFVKAFNIAGLPALVILFGLGVWFHRHSRKRRIRMIFTK
ncbi:MAG: GldG family protein [Deltaproteobacteria bacterium]|nr:GldG family protein [Deltaproteobacteria bacterium]